MKITLIQPAKPDDKSQAAKDWSMCRPLSLLYLCNSVNKSKIHNCDIVDFEKLYVVEGVTDIEPIIASLKVDVFGVTATTFTRHEARAIIKLIRKCHPDKIIIVGGVHFMHCDIDTLENIPEVDVVVRGEGEKILVELLNALQLSTPLQQVQGITFRDHSGEIIRTNDSELYEDLDSIDIYKMASPIEYPEYLMGSAEKITAVSIMSSRGCPFRCLFCAKAGMKYRHRSTRSVVEELKYYIQTYGISAFNFLDLTFTANPQRSRELCQAIMDEGLNIQWWCETRANVPLDLVTLMSDAGCRYMVVGVETGAETVLERIQKGVTLDQVEHLLSHAQEVGIKTTAYFMCSHVDETYHDALQTLKFMKKIEDRYDVATTMQPCIVLPGTEIEAIARTRGIIPQEFSWADDFCDLLNAELRQVTTIPLFLDRLNRNQIKDILLKKNEITVIRYRYKTLSLSYLLEALNAHGFKKFVSILYNDFIALCKLSKVNLYRHKHITKSTNHSNNA